jgi:hypothetical protein
MGTYGTVMGFMGWRHPNAKETQTLGTDIRIENSSAGMK